MIGSLVAFLLSALGLLAVREGLRAGGSKRLPVPRPYVPPPLYRLDRMFNIFVPDTALVGDDALNRLRREVRQYGSVLIQHDGGLIQVVESDGGAE